MPADGQAVIIQELAGPRATLTLAGSDRPKPRVEVPTELRARQFWMPGSGVATTHVMGTKEMPVQLEGRWANDFNRILGQGPEDLVALTRGIQSRGNRCLITWGTTISRLGRIEMFTPIYVRDKVINYRIVFQVDAALEPGNPFRTPKAVVAAQAIRRRIDEVATVLSVVKAALGADARLKARIRGG